MTKKYKFNLEFKDKYRYLEALERANKDEVSLQQYINSCLIKQSVQDDEYETKIPDPTTKTRDFKYKRHEKRNNIIDRNLKYFRTEIENDIYTISYVYDATKYFIRHFFNDLSEEFDKEKNKDLLLLAENYDAQKMSDLALKIVKNETKNKQKIARAERKGPEFWKVNEKASIRMLQSLVDYELEQNEKLKKLQQWILKYEIKFNDRLERAEIKNNLKKKTSNKNQKKIKDFVRKKK